MAHVSKDTLRFMIDQVDWTAVMHGLVDTQPETVANLMNDHFASEPEQEPECDVSRQMIEETPTRSQLVSLNRAFSYVVCACITKGPGGRQTTSDKIRAIKELREPFGLNLLGAKLAVEKMMDNYEKDPLYYPAVRSDGFSGYEFH